MGRRSSTSPNGSSRCEVKTAYFTEEGDHFLVRYNKKLHFHADSSREPREGRDASGRQFVEDWGWIGGPKDKRRREARRITLLRPGEEDIVLLTDLLDPETLSTEKLFLDVERELTACTVMWDVEQLVARVDRPWRANEVKSRLKELFGHLWSERWLKAKSYRRRPHPPAPRLGVHVSVHRILSEAKQKRAAPRPP